MDKKYVINNICSHAYETLISTQYESGEFGKSCPDIIHNEDTFRHSTSTNDAALINKATTLVKPNCSVTLISALGISCYKGLGDDSVVRTRRWFTESDYISKGWFHQKIHVVDANPFGQSTPQISVITDVRHTATALLAALCFDAPVTFIADALRNLLTDNCRDYNHKGWRSDIGAERGAPTDLYTTVYMLASLYSLKTSKSYEAFGLTILEINQLLSNGLNAICDKLPNELGYNNSIEQVLRTNATILFFLAPLLADIFPEYLEESVRFIMHQVQRDNGIATWLDGDFDTTINILAGLVKAEKYLDEKKVDIGTVIKEAKFFIENRINTHLNFHPVSLGFILFIYTNKPTPTPIPKSIHSTKLTRATNGRLHTSGRDEGTTMDRTSYDILLMVSTKAEERAITEMECFEDRELDDGISYLTRSEKGLNIAMARGFGYGELDAAIMAQTIYLHLKPKVLAMAGFCAGKRGKQTLGDVVIAERVFNYDIGKQVAKNKIEPQISSYNLDTRVKQKIERYGEKWRTSIQLDQPKDFDLQCCEFIREISNYADGIKPDILYDKMKYPNWRDIVKHLLQKKYIEKISNNEQIMISKKGIRYLNELLLLFPEGFSSPTPSTMLGSLATGTKVQQWDGIFNYLNTQFDRKCSVLDMEGHAMAKIADFNRCPFIISKGVGDFAQNGKKFDNRFIDYAVYSSYRFLIEFLGANLSIF